MASFNIPDSVLRTTFQLWNLIKQFIHSFPFKKLKLIFVSRITNIYNLLSLFQKLINFEKKQYKLIPLMFRSTKISIMNIILSCLCNSFHLLFPFARYGIKFFNKNIVGPSRIQWQKWPPPLPESTVVCFQVCPLFHASYNSPLGNCVTSRQVTSNQLRPNSFILCANLSFGPILKVTVS